MTDILMLKLGELVLKGLNRNRFEQLLLTSLRRRLKPLGEFTVRSLQSTIYIEPQEPGADMAAAREAVRRVFGLSAVTLARRCEPELTLMADTAAACCPLKAARSFKVEARRADKSYPLKSPQLCAELGGLLLERFPHLTVDVHRPEVTVWVEIREGGAYIHPAAEPGAGGLPVGMSGRGLLLLSGGIDSPVAGWRMARRGMELSAVHFHSYPYTSPEALEKTMKLAALLARWHGRLAVWVVPLTAIQERLRAEAPEELFTLLMRRSMCRIAEALARRESCGCLITGESLGQVASQTLEAMAVTEQSVSLPLFRPLVGMDKEEIITTARHIGTFDTSILPYEDCCTVFTPKHPKTKPKLRDILVAEESGSWLALEQAALENTEKKMAYSL